MVQILGKILFTDGANIRERSCSQADKIMGKILFTDGANIREHPVHSWCKY
jgi:hypothetical protein